MLRIDDLDFERKRPEYVQDIFKQLDHFGLDWDEGPESPDDFERNWSQKHRLDWYADLFESFDLEAHAFACSCSRKDIQQRAKGVHYDGYCMKRALPFHQKEVNWRLKLPQNAFIVMHDLYGKISMHPYPEFEHYAVIRKKNGHPSYQWASVADDVEFGINTVARGVDLWESSLLQLHIAELHPAFQSFQHTTFMHHTLIRGKAGAKLSKSAGAKAIQLHKEEGLSRERFILDFFDWLGWSESTNRVEDIPKLMKEYGMPAILAKI